MVAPITISVTPSCSPHEITLRSKFLLKSDKVDISQYGGHFGKKMAAWKENSIFPSCSPHQSTPRYQFSLQSNKVDIFEIWQPS